MTVEYEIPKTKADVLIALTDGTRINTSIFLDAPLPGAPISSAFTNFFNTQKSLFIPTLIDDQKFLIVNKKQILYVQKKETSEADFSNVQFNKVKFFFSKSSLCADIYLFMQKHEQRLIDAFNLETDFIACHQFHQLTLVNKANIVKVQTLT